MPAPSLVDLVAKVAESLPAVTVRLGMEYLEENQSPPRAVFVPTEDVDLPPSKSAAYGDMWRTVGSIGVGVEVHLWAAGAPTDMDPYAHIRATEALRNQLLYVVHCICAGAYQRQGGRWVDADVGQYGRGYVQRLQFAMPIVPTVEEVDFTTTVIQTAETPGGATFPAGDVTNPPPAP